MSVWINIKLYGIIWRNTCKRVLKYDFKNEIMQEMSHLFGETIKNKDSQNCACKTQITFKIERLHSPRWESMSL